MKSILMVYAVGVLGLVWCAGCASERETRQPQDYSRTDSQYLTDSYLPQNATRSGPVTNGKNNVRIIDQSEIDRSGGANVQQSLRQLGVQP